MLGEDTRNDFGLGAPMKLATRIVLVVGILIQPGISSADAPYMGVGAISCGKLVSDHRENATQVEAALMAWAQGFISGANTVTKGEYRDMAAMSLDVQKQFLLGYCEAHPAANFIDAAVDLYFKLPLKGVPK